MPTINLTKTPILDKDNKPVEENGQVVYKQNDLVALSMFLSNFNSSEHDNRNQLTFLQLVDKVEISLKNNSDKVDVTMNEVLFLKDYLVGFDKFVHYVGGQRQESSLGVDHMRSKFSLLEQLDGILNQK